MPDIAVSPPALVLKRAEANLHHVTFHVIIMTNWPWSSVLEKLTGSKLVKKFSAFYGTWKFINAFTRTLHPSLFWVRSIQPMPHPTSWRSILILSDLRLDFPSGLFRSSFSTRTLCTPLLSPYKLRSPPISFFLIWSPDNIWWVVQIVRLLIMQSSSLPCYLVSLWLQYPPQHPVLEYLQLSFLHQCERPSFLPIKNNRHNHTRVGTLIVATIYLQLIQNRYIFRSFTVLQCSHQHCVQPVASDVEVVGYL